MTTHLFCSQALLLFGCLCLGAVDVPRPDASFFVEATTAVSALESIGQTDSLGPYSHRVIAVRGDGSVDLACAISTKSGFRVICSHLSHRLTTDNVWKTRSVIAVGVRKQEWEKWFSDVRADILANDGTYSLGILDATTFFYEDGHTTARSRGKEVLNRHPIPGTSATSLEVFIKEGSGP